MIQGRSFTSNTTKLLKHLDKLQRIQQGQSPSPVMLHMSICNPCNLSCSFCCFANRKMKQIMPLERAKKAIDEFCDLGIKGLEFTGGGEPTLHPDFCEIVNYAHSKNIKLGLCTNGTTIKKYENKDVWDKFEWVRLGLYGFTENYTYDLDILRKYPNLKISAAYVWDMNLSTSRNPNITGVWTNDQAKKLSTNHQTLEHFYEAISWAETNKIPTRIAFNSIKESTQVLADIEIIRKQLKDYEEINQTQLQYAFLSDFNYKGTRKNDNCYMHMVKPFLFTDGNVYVCPSAELSPENNYDYVPTSEFKVCDIDSIKEFYQNVTRRQHGCAFCKYTMQNELIDEILTPTEHNEFA